MAERKLTEAQEREIRAVDAGPRPTADTDPGDCRWCFEEAVGGKACPYHSERSYRQ